jgi:uncharacterized protein (TIGR03437 family)
MANVQVRIGGVAAAVQFAGASPESIFGLVQINAAVPPGIAAGAAVPLVVSIGNVASQAGVTVAIS